jgi:hypothetical protein
MSMNNYMDIAQRQLTLLYNALAPAANGVVIEWTKINAGLTSGSDASSKDHATFTDQMLTVLYGIRINTWAIAGNTAEAIKTSGKGRDGVYNAAGGLITGPGTGTSDSIPAWLSNREFVIKNAAVEKFGAGFFDQLNAGILPSVFNDNMGRVPTTIENNFSPPPSAPITNVVHFPRGGGRNDNAELIAKVEALTEEVKKLREENTKVTIGTSNQLARGVDKLREDIGENVDKGARRIADQSRMNAQMAKQRGS